MNRAGRALGWLAGGVAVGAAGVGGYTAWTLSGARRPWPDYAFTPFELGLDAGDVRFRASDGVELAGWWLDDPQSSTVVVVCHGHRSNKSDMLGIGPMLYRRGNSVLLFDFRGNGDSGDGPQSLAYHEQRDLRAAIDWVAEHRPDCRIAVTAFSMGAATAILEAADDPRVEALVLDSPFSTMTDVVAANYRRYRLPTQPALPLADLVTRLRYGYAFSQVRPLDVVHRLAPRPMLLMHGTDDRVIPYQQAELLAEAAHDENLEFVTFDGLDHCGGYFADRPGYVDRVAGFLERSLPSRPRD